MLENPSPSTDLLTELESLRQQVEQLKRDKLDLEIALETTTEHGDTVELELYETNKKLQAEILERQLAQATLQQILETVTRDKQDLQIMLATVTEHGDTVEYQLYSEAVELMRRSEEQFRAIAEATPIMMMISDISTGVIIYANSTAIKSLGMSPDDSITDKLQDFYYDPADEQKLLANLAAQGYVHSYEMQVKKPNGDIIWVTASLHPLTLSNKDSKDTYLTTFFDITERKNIEKALQSSEAELRLQTEELEHRVEQRTAELQAANRKKSEFFANMSHELRTPLNAILGFTQLLISEPSIDGGSKETLGIIRSSGEHLLALINDVLEMSRIEAGKIMLNKKTCDLYQLLTRLENMLRIKAEQKDIFLRVHRTIDVPQYVQTDEIKLSQILINLLNNALKFTYSGGVELRVSKLSSQLQEETGNTLAHLCFEVEDTGVGIAEENLDSIFEPFVQVYSTQRVEEGSGLGLSISRKFAQLMGGEIYLDSVLEQGTIFRFEVQLEVDTERIKFEAEKLKYFSYPNASLLSLNKQLGNIFKSKSLRILLAEDNLVNQKIATLMLNKLGYSVDTAENGHEVLEALSHQDYDLILMDIQMPGLNGFETAQHIYTKQEKSQKVPIIVALTASNLEEERKHCLGLGMSYYISKPIKLEELQEILEKCECDLHKSG